MLGGQFPRDMAISENKGEPTSENNTASSHSSDAVACMQKTRECSEKESDVQVCIFNNQIFCNHLCWKIYLVFWVDFGTTAVSNPIL